MSITFSHIPLARIQSCDHPAAKEVGEYSLCVQEVEATGFKEHITAFGIHIT